MNSERKRIFSHTPWESKVGYCRAVRVGNQIAVSGTTASDADGRVMGDSAYEQARYIFEKIRIALADLNADYSHVVRTRMFVTNVDDWQEVGRAHAEFCGAHPPAATMVEVSRLVDPAHLVEIEIDAIL